MEQSSILKAIDEFFTSDDRSIIAEIPADLAVNYFIDHNYYTKWAEHKMDKLYSPNKFEHFIFRYSTENFLKFIPLDSLDIDYKDLIKYDKFTIGNFKYEDKFYLLCLDRNNKKQDSKNILLDYVISRYNHVNYERIFIMNSGLVIGHLSIFNHEGFLLTDEKKKCLNIKEKIVICSQILKKIENLCINSNYYDLDLRSIFCITGEENKVTDVQFLCKKIYSDSERQSKNKDKTILTILSLFLILFTDISLGSIYKENINELFEKNKESIKIKIGSKNNYFNTNLIDCFNMLLFYSENSSKYLQNEVFKLNFLFFGASESYYNNHQRIQIINTTNITNNTTYINNEEDNFNFEEKDNLITSKSNLKVDSHEKKSTSVFKNISNNKVWEFYFPSTTINFNNNKNMDTYQSLDQDSENKEIISSKKILKSKKLNNDKNEILVNNLDENEDLDNNLKKQSDMKNINRTIINNTLINNTNVFNENTYIYSQNNSAGSSKICSASVSISSFDFCLVGHDALTIDKIQEILDKSNLFFSDAEKDYNDDNFISSKEKYERCVYLRRRYIGSKKETALALTGLGGVYMKLGEYKLALESYFESLTIYEKSVGEKHFLIASVLHNIGLIYDLCNKYDQALIYYNKALQIKIEVLGEFTASSATTYYNIAGIHDIKGDYSEALKIYKITLQIYNSVLSEYNIDSATVYNNIGLLLDKMGKTDESIESYLHSIRISTKILNTIHPLVATSYNNLGLVYFKSNRLKEAIDNFEKSIIIREKISSLGFKNADLASSYNNLAGIYYKSQEFEQALEKYQKCLAINIDLLGILTPETATAYNNIGLVHVKLKQFDEALISFTQGYEIRKKLFGQQDKETLNVETNIAGVYFKKKQSEKSIEYYLKILASYPKSSPETIGIYTNLGHSYNNLSDFKKSLECYLNCLDLSRQIFGENSLYTAEAYSNLSNCYENLEDNEKSKEYMMKSVLIKENINYQPNYHSKHSIFR
jgi:tetratricopeptide (TPR) repeat protein